MFYQNYLAMRNTADVTDGKPIAVWSQSISGVNAFNPLVAFHDIHRRKREVLFFFCLGHHTRHYIFCNYVINTLGDTGTGIQNRNV
jgi:hypothetical protein